MTEISVRLQVHTGLFLMWVRTLRFLAPVLISLFGAAPIMRWVEAGRFLVLLRFDSGRWHFLRSDE